MLYAGFEIASTTLVAVPTDVLRFVANFGQVRPKQVVAGAPVVRKVVVLERTADELFDLGNRPPFLKHCADILRSTYD